MTGRVVQSSSAPDPVAALIRTFARGLGHRTDETAPVADTWRALRSSGDLAPGLSFAAWAAPSAVGGPLIPLLANSPDLRFMLEQLHRFHPLFGQDRVELALSPRRATLTLLSSAGDPALPDTVDACFALLCRVIRPLTEPGLRPERVLLRRPPPARPDLYREALGTVWFAADHDSCEFDAVALDTPIAQADPMVLRILQPYAERQVAQQGQRWTVTVTRILTASVEGASPSLLTVSRHLAVSPRSLQQRLQAEGTTYSTLVDAVQRERALALLAGKEQLLTGIAARVGFSSPAALTRAVRRWTGMSPSQYRSLARSEPGGA